MSSAEQLNGEIYSTALRLRDLCIELAGVHAIECNRIQAMLLNNAESEELQARLEQVKALKETAEKNVAAAHEIVVQFPPPPNDAQLEAHGGIFDS